MSLRTRQRNITFGELQGVVREIEDQTIAPEVSGVLNPEVFEWAKQSSSFYAMNLPLEQLINESSTLYAQEMLRKAELPKDATHAQVLLENLEHICGEIFSIPAARIGWRFKAPFLIANVLEQGLKRPLCGFFMNTGDTSFKVRIHPGKKRLSILRFLGHSRVQVFVQIPHFEGFTPAGAEEIKNVDQVCAFFGTSDLFFRTVEECQMHGFFRLEVQCYGESHRRIHNNLTSWEDELIDEELLRWRLNLLEQGVTVRFPPQDFERIRQCAWEYFSYKSRPFAFWDQSKNLKLHFEPQNEAFTPPPGFTLEINFAPKFCLSQFLLFMTWPQDQLNIHSGNQTAKLTFTSSATSQSPVHLPQIFSNWERLQRRL